MEIAFQTKLQVKIADALWGVDSPEELDAVFQKYGEFHTRPVYEMIISAAIDEEVEGGVDLSDAQSVIDRAK